MTTVTLTPFQDAVVALFAKANNVTPDEYARAYLASVFDVLGNQYVAFLAAQVGPLLHDDTKRDALAQLLTPKAPDPVIG